MFGTPFWGLILSGTAENNEGFPVSQRYAEFTGFYKLSASENQSLDIEIIFKKDGEVIGGNDDLIEISAKNYTMFSLPINYYSSEVPDTCIINIVFLDTAEIFTTSGGAWIDDLTLTGSVDVKEFIHGQVPLDFKLSQNYPNPFNPSTKIEYSIPQESFVNLKVYNFIGHEVATLVNKHQKTGTYRVDFNAKGLTSGIYIAKLTANGFARTIKMTLMK